jgi:hypothetical protein
MGEIDEALAKLRSVMEGSRKDEGTRGGRDDGKEMYRRERESSGSRRRGNDVSSMDRIS